MKKINNLINEYHRRLFLITIIVLLCTSSCEKVDHAKENIEKSSSVANQSQSSEIYFIGYNKDKTIELWRTDLSGNSQSPVYVEPANYPFYLLPEEEQFFLGNCTRNDECSNDLDGMSSRYWWGPLHLSPKKDIVLWTETAEFCPSQSGYCDGGMSRLVLWKINQLEKSIIFELPYHISLLSHQTISSLEWSPDNQKVSFITRSKEAGWNRLKVIDIDSLLIQTIGENVSEYQWSPAGSKIAYMTRIRSDCGLSVVEKNGDKNFETNEKFKKIIGFSWSPDEREVIFSAISQDGKPGVYLINLSEKKMRLLFESTNSNLHFLDITWSPNGKYISVIQNDAENKNGALLMIDVSNISTYHPVENIKVYVDKTIESSKVVWSPDGNVVAMNVASDENGGNTGIVFYEPGKERIISNFNQKNVSTEWSFSEDDHSIVILLREQEQNCPRKDIDKFGIFNLENETFSEIRFNPILENNIKTCDFSISNAAFVAITNLEFNQ